MRILLVDGDGTRRGSLAYVLRTYCYEVVGARNGRTGWTMFNRIKPDLVITATKMPEVDGLTFATQVKASSPDIPVIFMPNGEKDVSGFKYVWRQGEPIENFLKLVLELAPKK